MPSLQILYEELQAVHHVDLADVAVKVERTVTYYADLQHLSPYYFSTIIRESTDKTPLQWITMFTINLNKHYLADTEMSIKEIADTLHTPRPVDLRALLQTAHGMLALRV